MNISIPRASALRTAVRILLVDDDEDAYVLTKSLMLDFEERIYSLDWVQTYAEGISSILRGNHDVYLIDYMLGLRTGLDLITEARSRGCDRPMIFITTLDNLDVDVSVMRAGASDYLVKGAITPPMLERAIRYAIEHQRTLNIVRANARQLEDLNRQLRDSEAELTELNHAKDRFFSIISHDLKSPFSTLLGFSELLASCIHEMTSEQVSDAAQRIFQSSKNLYVLLENLLKWSRLQTGRMPFLPKATALYPLAQQVLSIYRDMSEQKQVTLHNAVHEHAEVYADTTMLQTILDNLVSNAIKFTPAGGNVTIEANLREAGMEIIVKDDGVGMDTRDIEKLFRLDIHHSTLGTEAEEGTGLGLLICQEMVVRNNGRISVESIKGEGAIFMVHLPSVPISEPGTSIDDEHNENAARSGGTTVRTLPSGAFGSLAGDEENRA
jgi:two-component system, sensor histidine kinase and response regulator